MFFPDTQVCKYNTQLHLKRDQDILTKKCKVLYGIRRSSCEHLIGVFILQVLVLYVFTVLMYIHTYVDASDIFTCI